MKIIYFIILLTITIGFYSCESSNKPNSNPLNYSQEQPFFEIEPYIPYHKLDNRIDLGMIYDYNKSLDSNYIRATFYDNRQFRDVGDLYINKFEIYSLKADKLFNIVQLIEGFIEFGTAYFMDSFIINHNTQYEIYNQNSSEFPIFNIDLFSLDDKLSIHNIKDLQNISKNKGFTVLTNLNNYTKTRIRIYNEIKSYLFYTSSKDSIVFTPEILSKIQPNEYDIEVLKGYYKIDTLENSETIITNHYSAYIFDTEIVE